MLDNTTINALSNSLGVITIDKNNERVLKINSYNYKDDINTIRKTRKIYLCKPNRKAICVLNGVKEETVEYRRPLMDIGDLSFELDKYIDNGDGELEESNGYDLLHSFMELYVDGVGYFQIQEPSISNDGYKETKNIVARSLEQELLDKDLVDWKVNTGEKDSLEYLADCNKDIEIITGTGDNLGGSFITFYNESNSQLSLLDLALEKTPTWTVGYVDPLLKDKKFSFNISSENIYAFLTKELASTAGCIFFFDTINKTINAYYYNYTTYDDGTYELIDNVGEDTSIFIGFRNLVNTINISCDEDSIYTRYNVTGSDEINLSQVNFGETRIFNIDYFLTTNYLPQETIDKVKAWKELRNTKRKDYVQLSKDYYTKNTEMYNLKYKVPSDGCNYKQWDDMTLELLNDNLDYYNKLLVTIGSTADPSPRYDENNNYIPYYKEDGTTLDTDKYLSWLDETQTGYWTFYEINKYTIPNIKIAIENFDAVKDDMIDYNKDYETDWELYGTVELDNKKKEYKELIDSLDKYKTSWEDLSTEEKSNHEEKTYKECHDKYILYSQYTTEINSRLDILNTQINSITAEMDIITTQQLDIKNEVSLYNEDTFTDEEIKTIEILFHDTDYSNENYVVTTSMSDSESIDVMNELYNNAMEELCTNSQPEYSFSTDIDNLYSLPEFADWVEDFTIGNFIRLGIRDDYSVKLRLKSVTYNPCLADDKITVEFSNMSNHKGSRNDFTSIFDNNISSSKNSISIGTNGAKTNLELSSEILALITSSSALNNKLQANVNGALASSASNTKNIISETVNTDFLATQIENIKELNANSAFIDYLNSTLIVASEIKVDNLKAKLAKIDIATVGDLFTESLSSVVSTSISSTVDTQFIKDAIVGNATMNDLFTSNFTVGEDEYGQIKTNGSTMQFLDAEGKVYIQLGTDESKNHSLIIKNYVDDGTGVKEAVTLLDANGVTSNAIADGLIVDQMVKRKDTNYAGISSDALNIDDVVKSINNGKTTINSSLIYFDKDNQTLVEKLNSMETEIVNANGDDYEVQIISSNGHQVIKSTILTAIVYEKGTNNISPNVVGYQWYKDGMYLSGETSKRLIVSKDDIGKGTEFSCIVSMTDGGDDKEEYYNNTIVTAEGAVIAISDDINLAFVEDGVDERSILW